MTNPHDNTKKKNGARVDFHFRAFVCSWHFPFTFWRWRFVISLFHYHIREIFSSSPYISAHTQVNAFQQTPRGAGHIWLNESRRLKKFSKGEDVFKYPTKSHACHLQYAIHHNSSDTLDEETRNRLKRDLQVNVRTLKNVALLKRGLPEVNLSSSSNCSHLYDGLYYVRINQQGGIPTIKPPPSWTGCEKTCHAQCEIVRVFCFVLSSLIIVMFSHDKSVTTSNRRTRYQFQRPARKNYRRATGRNQCVSSA